MHVTFQSNEEVLRKREKDREYRTLESMRARGIHRCPPVNTLNWTCKTTKTMRTCRSVRFDQIVSAVCPRLRGKEGEGDEEGREGRDGR